MGMIFTPVPSIFQQGQKKTYTLKKMNSDDGLTWDKGKGHLMARYGNRSFNFFY